MAIYKSEKYLWVFDQHLDKETFSSSNGIVLMTKTKKKDET